MTNKLDHSPLREYASQLPAEQKRMIIRQEHCVFHSVEATLGNTANMWSEGLGMNLPPLFQKNQELAYPHSDHDWERLIAHMNWLGLDSIRYWLYGEAVFPERGNFLCDHLYIQRLQRFDDWARQRGSRLILDLTGMPEWLRYKAPEPLDGILAMYTAPADIQMFVDEYALPILRHVVENLGLDSVRYVCLFNEPFNVDLGMDTFYTPEGINPFAHYVELHAYLRMRLDQVGIPESRLGLIGPDSHDRYIHALEEFERQRLDLFSSVAMVDEHAYRMRLDYLPEAHHVPTMRMSDLVASHVPSIQLAHAHSKPYVLTEYSCFYYATTSGALRHESTITEAEFIIRSMAAGVDGALRYSLINSGEADGNWQCVNTADGSYSPSPNIYYAYAVLCRYAPRGGRLRHLHLTGHEGREAYVHAVGIEYVTPGDNDVTADATLLVVNDHPAEAIVFKAPAMTSKPLVAWQTNSDKKHNRVAATIENGSVNVLLPPMSVTAITTFDIGPDDDGVMPWNN